RRLDEQRLDGLRATDLQRAGERRGSKRRRSADGGVCGVGQLHARRPRLLLGRSQRGGGGRAGGGSGRRGRPRGWRRRGPAGLWRGWRAGRGPACGGAAGGRRRAPSRSQRPLLVRERQEVQALPRRLGAAMVSTAPGESTPERLAAIREQMKLLTDYL